LHSFAFGFFLDTQIRKAGRESRPVTVKGTGNTVTGAGRLLTERRARLEGCVKSREKTGLRKGGKFRKKRRQAHNHAGVRARVMGDVVVAVVIVMVFAMMMVVMEGMTVMMMMVVLVLVLMAVALPAFVPCVRDRHPLPPQGQAAAETKGSVTPARWAA
jgi:Flp pilus assembly protein TadB